MTPRAEFEKALVAYDEAYESSDYEVVLRDKVIALHAAAIERAERAEAELFRIRVAVGSVAASLPEQWRTMAAERDEWKQRAEQHSHWHAFGCLVWSWLAEHWDSEDGWDLAQMAVTAGLAERVKYDPAIHGDCEAEPGDEITYPLKGDPAFVNVAEIRAERDAARVALASVQRKIEYARISDGLNNKNALECEIIARQALTAHAAEEGP